MQKRVYLLFTLKTQMLWASQWKKSWIWRSCCWYL